ncbi:hypothetical protein BG842_03340 [Haladaptatus sp. W1]|nr:hypothetical protein BG842_03340 [Haladaptatus sp. W1]
MKGSYDAAFGDCQDFTNVQYNDDTETATKLCELAMTSERSASPTWSRVEDVDGDGDDDTKFKFKVSDLQLESDDTYLILKGESTDGDCTFLGIDSVRVLGGNGGNQNGNAGARGGK